MQLLYYLYSATTKTKSQPERIIPYFASDLFGEWRSETKFLVYFQNKGVFPSLVYWYKILDRRSMVQPTLSDMLGMPVEYIVFGYLKYCILLAKYYLVIWNFCIFNYASLRRSGDIMLVTCQLVGNQPCPINN